MSAYKRLRWFILSLSAIALTTGTAVGEDSLARIVSFGDQKTGQQPKGMTCALTGQGRPGAWTLQQDDTAASRSLVLAQTDADPTGCFLTYGKKVKVPSGAWSELRVVAKGSLLEVSWNGDRLFEVEDSTFVSAGRVGIWTKADSVTYFDALRVSVAK